MVRRAQLSELPNNERVVQREQFRNHNRRICREAITITSPEPACCRRDVRNATSRSRPREASTTAGRFFVCDRSVKGTATRTTAPGPRLGVEVRLITEKTKRRVLRQQCRAEGCFIRRFGKTNLNGILTRRNRLGEFDVPGIDQLTLDRYHTIC